MLSWERLTPTERKALDLLEKHAQDKGWFTSVGNGISGNDEGKIRLNAPLGKVQKFLTKSLKPGRKMVDVVAFKNGRIEEVSSAKTTNKEVKETPAKGVSIALPTLGCPEPRLAQAELRAREVLFAFIDEGQQEDFGKFNAFVSTGAETGHRYMVTSRHAKDRLAVTRRQLFDLDEQRPYCVHDYAVPAAEEMLAMHLLLQTRENYLRHLE